MRAATDASPGSAIDDPRAETVQNPSTRWLRRAGLWVALMCLYLAAALFTVGTQPMTECTTTVFGGPGDSTAGLIWMMWNYEELGVGPLTSTTPLLDAPYGGDLWRPILVTSSAVIVPSWAAARLLGPVCAWNIAVLGGFVFSALAMFALVRWVTRHTPAAVIAGYAFAFSPFAVRKAEGHLNYVHLWVFPVILLAVLWCWQRPSKRRAVAVGAATALAGYVDGYYLLIASIMTASLVLVGFAVTALRGERRQLLDYLALVGVAAASALFLLAPIGFVMATTSAEVNASVSRSLADLSTYSARPHEYVLPARTHPYFSNYFGGWQDRNLHGSNYSEQTLYVGISVIALAGIAVIQSLRRTRPSALRIPLSLLVPLMVGTAAIAAAFSAPPRLGLGSVEVPMPSSLVYSFAPFWRVFARFFIPLHATLVTLAGVGIAILIGRRGWRSAALALAVATVVAWDLLAVPPRPHWSYAADSPSVYKWVGQEDDDGIVANYPIIDPPFPRHLTYLTYQRVHGRPIFNGAEPGSESWQLKAGLIGLADPQTIPALRRLGVTTVLVHHEYYEPFLSDAARPPAALVPRFSSEWATAFDIAPGPEADAVVTMEKGFLDGELNGYASQRWMGSTAKLGLQLFEEVEQLAVSFEATSFARPRRLMVRQEGRIVWDGTIASDATTTVRIVTSSDAPLALTATPGEERISSVLTRSGDDRVVSLALSQLSASAVRP